MPSRVNPSKRSPPESLLICDHRAHSHSVQFYLDEQFLVRIAGGLLFNALGAGDGAIVLATRAHQVALARRLSWLGLDLADCVRKGTYVEIDASGALNESLSNGNADFSRLREHIVRTLQAVNGAATVPAPRAMVYGELVSLLWERRNSEAVLALEQLWEGLAREYSFSLLCGYAIREFCEPGTEDQFLQFCNAHSTLISPDEYPSAEVERRIMRATALAYSESPSTRPA